MNSYIAFNCPHGFRWMCASALGFHNQNVNVKKNQVEAPKRNLPHGTTGYVQKIRLLPVYNTYDGSNLPVVSHSRFAPSAQELSNAMTPPQLEVFFKRMVALGVPKDPWLIH